MKYVVVWKTEDLWGAGRPVSKQEAKRAAIHMNRTDPNYIYAAMPIHKARVFLQQGEWINID